MAIVAITDPNTGTGDKVWTNLEVQVKHMGVDVDLMDQSLSVIWKTM